jgi:hypothetical protein
MPVVRPRPAVSSLAAPEALNVDGGARRGPDDCETEPADRSGGMAFTVYFDFAVAFFNSFPSPFALPMVSW